MIVNKGPASRREKMNRAAARLRRHNNAILDQKRLRYGNRRFACARAPTRCWRRCVTGCCSRLTSPPPGSSSRRSRHLSWTTRPAALPLAAPPLALAPPLQGPGPALLVTRQRMSTRQRSTTGFRPHLPLVIVVVMAATTRLLRQAPRCGASWRSHGPA